MGAYAVSGPGNNPTATLSFLSEVATVTVGVNESVYVSVTKVFGSTGNRTGLDIYLGARLVGNPGLPTTFGVGLINNKVSQNNKVPMTLTGVISSLAPGTYQIGMAGLITSTAWNDNGNSYVSVLVLKQ